MTSKFNIAVAGCAFEYDAPIAPKTSFRIGGTADAVAYPESENALCALLKYLSANGIKHMILGNGSNTLFCSDRYSGVLILTKKLADVRTDGEYMTFGCGISLTSAAKEAYTASLSGLEFAYGIPGTFGGGVCMNAGAYGGQLSDVVVSSEACTDSGERVTVNASEHRFAYRESVFQHGGLILLSSRTKLCRAPQSGIKAKMDELMSARIEKQPLDMPSAGSVFKRGNGFITAQVIDRCGLKGLAVGGAVVSPKHAGFIVNTGNATAGDVIALIDKVKNEVFRLEGKELECEIKIVD